MPKNNEFANKVNNSSHVSTLAHDTDKRVIKIAIDDIVIINGITGYVDFIGEEVIVLVDSKDNPHVIKISEITEATLIENRIEGNYCSIIMEV